jgi:hypothetical protein
MGTLLVVVLGLVLVLLFAWWCRRWPRPDGPAALERAVREEKARRGLGPRGGPALVLGLVCCLPGAARADWGSWEPPTTGEKILLGVTEAAIVADCWTTADYLGRFRGSFESNPLIGKHPNHRELFAWCGAGMLGTAALWYVLPPPWRSLATGAIGTVELAVVSGNVMMGARFRF